MIRVAKPIFRDVHHNHSSAGKQVGQSGQQAKNGGRVNERGEK